MPEKTHWVLREKLLALLMIGLVMSIQGALPFFMIPTLGQAIWSMGFSESFGNSHFFSVYAHDFGAPEPAAIAFGLAGAWPAGVLIRAGLSAADAYASIALLWLGLAMISAYQLVRMFGASRSISLVGAAIWMTMPIIWAHSGYSMLSWGIALLSFYFLTAFRLFDVDAVVGRVSLARIFFYLLAIVISIFMDGYTFMMFAVGASIILLHEYVLRKECRSIFLKKILPIHLIGFGLAFILYTVYVGQTSFGRAPIDFFRGWGLDLSFLAIPTRGVLWLPDVLGFSVGRTDEIYFGDASVWRTTFALPVLLLGGVAWWKSRDNLKACTGILIVAIFGFYLALGPSFKINSIKPESLQLSHPRQASAMMEPSVAVAPTGTKWLSRNLPGFNAMRASYRWSAVGIFASWLLVMIWVSRWRDRRNYFRWIILFFLLSLNIPEFRSHVLTNIDGREMFMQIDSTLIPELREAIGKDEMTAFIPWGNDFFVNYLAPKVGFRTFNIGGDKNLAAAQAGWPPAMLHLQGDAANHEYAAAARMLIDGSADVLIIPYFDLLWSAHSWPCLNQISVESFEMDEASAAGNYDFHCFRQRRLELQPLIQGLNSFEYLVSSQYDFFTTIRMRPEYSTAESRAVLLKNILQSIPYPIVLGQRFKEEVYVLQKGWHAVETNHVWSKAEAEIFLPVPKDCENHGCDAVLDFTVFGASASRPTTVLFSSAELDWEWNEELLASSGEFIKMRVPLNGAKGIRKIAISVPNATSPKKLGISSDGRVLGIALKRIDISKH